MIMGCVNKTTCAKTYGDVYNALATQENHFNISQALYPAKKPSSVLVHITLYGANGTENCSSAAYTWSMSCLYAAFPGKVLAVLSLGSIVVPSRTEELSIRIPPFCCNVSTDNRKEIIIRVLAAVSGSFFTFHYGKRSYRSTFVPKIAHSAVPVSIAILQPQHTPDVLKVPMK